MDFNQYLKDRPRSSPRGAPMGNHNSSNLVAHEDRTWPYLFDVQELEFEDGEGDFSSVMSFPKTPEEESHMLTALYDYHQYGELFKDGDTIHLPDGTLFAVVDGVHVFMEV